jgi:SAM-dependent methyltransferase
MEVASEGSARASLSNPGQGGDHPIADRLYPTRLRHYPEVGAGGFSRVDGTVSFFSRVHSLIPETGTVVDLGAGRGSEHVDDTVPYRRRLRDLRGPGRHVIGLDVDPVIMENRHIDEAHVIDPDQPLPLADRSVDLILSDYVFEHIDDPAAFAREIERVLKPGGWLCARTPNLYSYVGVAVNLIPNRLHSRLLQLLQPGRKAIDVFPTRYRLNSLGALRRHFPAARWVHCSFTVDAEPVYVGGVSAAWSLVRLFQALTPRVFRTNLFVFVQKR